MTRCEQELCAMWEIERACGLCRRYGHRDADCPENPKNWPTPASGGSPS